MKMMFNRLTPEQSERLFCLLEELGEAQQAIGKILRHGYDSFNPDEIAKPTNKESLERELGDVMCIINMMIDFGDLAPGRMKIHELDKRKRIAAYLHHTGINQTNHSIGY